MSKNGNISVKKVIGGVHCLSRASLYCREKYRERVAARREPVQYVVIIGSCVPHCRSSWFYVQNTAFGTVGAVADAPSALE